jgi:DNA adenine methylase
MEHPPLKPFLRWAGSKRKLIPALMPYWSGEYARYIEPFMGSASYFFATEPNSAILSDQNECLVNAFNVIKHHPRRLYNQLAKLPRGEAAFYEVRAAYSPNLPKIIRATYFIYLNRFCFNGLYRTNKSGKFNVPYGATKSGDIPPLEHFYDVSKRLSVASIECNDYWTVMEQATSGDFIYIDPPYIIPNKRVFSEYGAKVFDWNDFKRLVALLDVLDQRGVKFLLSYADSSEAVELLSKWSISYSSAYRTMSGNAKSRKKESELIVTNIKLEEKKYAVG